ncbi:MAG TPA: YCF48-related protein [Thermoanaerobaculia bacterium]
MRRAPLLLLLVLIAGLALGQQANAPIERSIPAPLAPKSLLTDVVPAGSALVAVGDRGHILISGDGGASWTQADVPTRSMLTGVAFTGRNDGCAVGHDAVIVRTTDGGKTWERVHWDPEAEAPLLDVIFLDRQRGIAVGAYGSYLTTGDGGATWTAGRVSEDADYHLNQIARSATGKLYIAAEGGHAYRSDDDGATWIPLQTPYEGSLFGVLPLDGDSVLLFGLRGHILRSDDAGATWTEIASPTQAMLNAGVRLADGRIVLVGLGGTVLVSADGGRTFALREQERRAGFQAVAPAGSALLLAGDTGVRLLPLAQLGK